MLGLQDFVGLFFVIVLALLLFRFVGKVLKALLMCGIVLFIVIFLYKSGVIL